MAVKSFAVLSHRRDHNDGSGGGLRKAAGVESLDLAILLVKDVRRTTIHHINFTRYVPFPIYFFLAFAILPCCHLICS